MTQNEAEFDEIELVSKSQLKRDSLELQALGRQLAALPAEHLARIPLDPPLIEAIELAKRLQNKRSALKRHYQFLGKLLRARDPEPIRAALAEIEQQGRESIRRHHRAEDWRDRIVDEGNDAIDTLLDEVAGADRQKLRQLWRNHQKAPDETKRTQQLRLLYKEIYQALGNES
ncbi:MAG TPA: ribosome biogenesis factor YjgA [Gammaproteobacteria bacterium]|nr:ribosome biogenesis factor YjgA [Gammaproteobacteria bacterium]